MNPSKSIFKHIIFFFIFSLSLFAQNNGEEQISIPLSQPGEAGILIIDHYKGSISVTGYDGDLVVVKATNRFNQPTKNTNGMKRLVSNIIQLSVSEKNNEVTVESNSKNKTIDLDIKIPNNFSLNIQNYDNGKITVYNLTGEMEISNINGDIIVNNLSGSAVLNTVDGHIVVQFIKVTTNTPMAFSTIEGKIDVTLPSDVNALVKMKSDNGDIFSDFSIDLNKRKRKVEKSVNGNTNRVFLDEWAYGKINDGGPEFLFKSYDGNIYIRKN